MTAIALIILKQEYIDDQRQITQVFQCDLGPPKHDLHCGYSTTQQCIYLYTSHYDEQTMNSVVAKHDAYYSERRVL